MATLHFDSMNEYLVRYLQRIQEKGLRPIISDDAAPLDLVDRIEEVQKIVLPDSIRELLLLVGNRLVELDAPFAPLERLLEIKKEAEHLLEVVKMDALPASAFVYSMVSPEEFNFMVCDGSDDNPETWFFYVDYGNVFSDYGKFWDSMYASLADD